MAKRGNDKRQHPRVEARLAMQLAEETLGEALVTTESLNISRGGVYCESPEYLAPLSRVALTVVLPAFGAGERPRMLRSEGVVVRCESLSAVSGRKRYQLACCFTGLDTDARALLDEFVAWRALRGRAAAKAGVRTVKRAVLRAGARKAVRAKAAKKRVVARTTKAAPKAARGRGAAPKRAPARRATPKKK